MLTEKDIEILNVLKNKEGKISPARTNEKYLRKHGYYEYLLNRYSDNTIPNCIPETLYRLINDIENVPVCKACGNLVSFDLGNRSYPQWCSAKCRNNDPDVKQKNAKGVSEHRKLEYATKKEEIMAKRAATLKKHYGEDNSGSPFCCKVIKDKIKEVFQERFGKDSYILSNEEHNRIKNTIEKKNIQM